MTTKYKVILVDDEIIVRQGIEFMMDWKQENCEIAGKAASAAQALEMIEEIHPDVVISDIVMPGMDGVELTRTIQEKYPDIKVIILSSYSDFEYVRSCLTSGAVDYILKPALSQETLRNSLHKVLQTIEPTQKTSEESLSFALSRYMLGFDSEVPDNIQSWNRYILLGGLKSDDLFRKQIPHLIKSMNWCEMISIYTELSSRGEGLLLCLKNPPENLSDLLDLQLQQWLEEGQFAAISEMFEDIHTLHQVFDEQLRPILLDRFYLKGRKTARFQDLPEHASLPFHLQSFILKVSRHKYPEAFSQLLDYVRQAIETHQSEAELKSSTANAIYSLINELEDAQVNMDHLAHFKLGCLNIMQECIYAEDFQNEIEKILADFEIILKSYPVKENRHEIVEITRYMQENLARPLTLQDIADRFGFSYSYMSSIFASAMDETFCEYLNRIRIEKACELLKDHSLSMSQIAWQCGYSDSSYFSKAFKRQTGLSPRAYRKKS